MRVVSFAHGDIARDYRLYLPAALPAPGKRSLVVLLHGCTQDAADVARGTRVVEAAGADSTIVLLPEQAAGAHPQRCWNWYDPAHQRRDTGEAALVAALIDRMVAEHGVDATRVGLMGISAGGALALNVAALFPSRVAALAVHSALPALAATNIGEALGVMREGSADTAALTDRVIVAMGHEARAIPLLIIHGERDAVVSVKAAYALEAQWRAVNARLGAPSSPVSLRIIPGLGHAWSGGDPSGTYTDPSAPEVTTTMLRFLRSHAAAGGR